MLSKRQQKILKFLHQKQEPYLQHLLCEKFGIDADGQTLKQLEAGNLVYTDHWYHYKEMTIEITDAGRAVVEQAKADSFRFWFPVAISIAALIVAILAYLKQ